VPEVIVTPEVREKNRLRARAWYLANREKAKAATRAYYLKNKERCNAYQKQWHAKNMDKVRASRTKWIKNNKDKVRASFNAWRKRNPEWTRDQHYRLKFGITLDQYNSMGDAQNWVCKICGQKQSEHPSKALCLDHDHATGKVRGLLCFACNRGLGGFRDNPEWLMNACKYLAEYKPEKP